MVLTKKFEDGLCIIKSSENALSTSKQTFQFKCFVGWFIFTLQTQVLQDAR